MSFLKRFTGSRPEPSPDSPPEPEKRGIRRWAARFGVAGFAFFLIKGLLWLLVPWLIAVGVFR